MTKAERRQLESVYEDVQLARAAANTCLSYSDGDPAISQDLLTDLYRTRNAAKRAELRLQHLLPPTRC